MIGDELRLPIAWCEMGSCISHYADPETLGEANARARAIAAGWRVDALNRLACPKCQQTNACFWTSHPIVLWDRRRAVSTATLMAAAVRGQGTSGSVAAAENGPRPATIPAVTVSPSRDQHRERRGRSGHAH